MWKGNPDTEMPSGGSGLGFAIPLAIFMVASPMNLVSAAQQYNRYMAAQPAELVYTPQEESVPEDTYMLVPSTQEPEKPQKQTQKPVHVGSIETIYGEKFKVFGYSNDDNPATIEKYIFTYYKNLGDKTGMMSGKLGVFCPEPRDDGRYL